MPTPAQGCPETCLSFTGAFFEGVTGQGLFGVKGLGRSCHVGSSKRLIIVFCILQLPMQHLHGRSMTSPY